MTWWQSIILGIVEGLTEFLPVSSTGHMVLTSEALGLPLDSSFLTTFNIVIQLGAILAVVVLYWRDLLVNRRIMLRLLVALGPGLVGGFLLYKLVTENFMRNPTLVLWSLAVGGIGIILFEKLHGERAQATTPGECEPSSLCLERITFREAFLIGLCQIVAMIPGVSRAAATVFGGLLVGLRRRTAVEFSFLLAVPTMTAAAAKSLYEDREQLSLANLELLAIGFVTAFIVAILAITTLLRFIRSHDFTAFGIYRIVAAGAFAAFLWLR